MGKAGLKIGLERLAAAGDVPRAVVALGFQQVGQSPLIRLFANADVARLVQGDEGGAGGVSVGFGGSFRFAGVKLRPAAILALLAQ